MGFFNFLSHLKVDEVKENSIELWNLFSFSCSMFSHNLFASHITFNEGQVFKAGKKMLHAFPLPAAINKAKPLLFSTTHIHSLYCLWGYKRCNWELVVNIDRLRKLQWIVFLLPRINATCTQCYLLLIIFTIKITNINVCFLFYHVSFTQYIPT